MKLAIISHTEHYRDSQGRIVGWGPTVTEINHLIRDFDKIYHLAFFHPEDPPASSLPYTSSDIEFIALPICGGRSLVKKLSVFNKMPATLWVIEKILKKVDVFQFRAPVGMGVYLIPWLSLFHKKKGWYKYAGNWNQQNPPLGFFLQRWMLKKQKRSVTINGIWPDQPGHCISFENPCLTSEDLKEGKCILKTKNYEGKFSYCFVGRLEDEKGVQRILDAFKDINSSKVEKIHFIGNGAKLDYYMEVARNISFPVEFHGFISRTEIFQIYKRCQFLLLPSTASEGFPKVIAEAMNFGCIPIVSDISSIGHYLQDTENGFLVNPVTAKSLHRIIHECNEINPDVLSKMAYNNHEIATLFTYNRYNSRVRKEILIAD